VQLKPYQIYIFVGVGRLSAVKLSAMKLSASTVSKMTTIYRSRFYLEWELGERWKTKKLWLVTGHENLT
jgi:hypothetical protein